MDPTRIAEGLEFVYMDTANKVFTEARNTDPQKGLGSLSIDALRPSLPRDRQ